ncbi:hypothetical protein BJ912DRAFT_988692 [Pholiota molesta]|nr:hypothetical protein BJ912DRAFT_988692 [Pholiota molesta]
MTIPELPQDIIDTIVQAFAEIVLSDKDQLKKICLVSHAFVPQSQRCIFHTISLLRDGYRNPNPPYHPFGERIHVLGRKLHALLQTSPHLFAYVHVLKIHAWSSAELAWVASMGEEAAAIIHACPALQTLEWALNHPLNGPYIPHFLLSALASLSALRLEKVQQFFGSRKTRSRSPLQRLCIAESNPAIRLLLDQKILYGHNDEDVSLMHDLLHQAQGLQEFHVVLRSNGNPSGLKSLNIGPLRNLRRISILTRHAILRETYSFMKHAITIQPL